MSDDPQKHRRRSIRLKGYDYHSPGAYFVTICTQGCECILDDPVVNGIITDVWQALPGWFPTITLDEFVVMPNHVHFILWIHPSIAESGVGASPAPTDGNDGVVGAMLAVAYRRDGTPWVIPSPKAINPHLWVMWLGRLSHWYSRLIWTGSRLMIRVDGRSSGNVTISNTSSEMRTICTRFAVTSARIRIAGLWTAITQ